LAEQHGRVEARFVSEDLDDAPVPELEAVAERAVDNVATPVLRQAVDVRELVHETRRSKHPASDDRVALDELDAEAIVIGAVHMSHAPGEDLTAVAADLLTAQGDQLGGGKPFMTEVTVHVCGGSVAGLTGVDHDH
jgi:hypothetical protein